MAISETEYLLELWSKNVCPWCEETIPLNSRVGSGRKSEGGFCSLDCYTRYYSIELNERAGKVFESTHKKIKLTSNDQQ